MGNHANKPENILMLEPQNWIQADQDEEEILFSNVNPFRKRLLANRQTGQLLEQYELNFISEEDYNNYIKQLTFRQAASQYTDQSTHTDPKECIYPIRYFTNKSKQQMCTTVYTGCLYIDKVDLRLKQINDIPFPDLLYMYKATLEGFKLLYERVGYFDIQEQMIFINRRGYVKVWMNSNLSKNYPNFQKTQSMTSKSRQESQSLYGSQAQMARHLIQLIQKNADDYEESQLMFFSQYLAEKNILDRLSFDYCLQEFTLYLNQNNLYCSEYMKSIPELFNPEEYSRLKKNQELGYDQSHVNQITSQHINQINQRFEPMEIIEENDSPQKHYHESKVSAFFPPPIQQARPFTNQSRLVEQVPFHQKFISQSRYSENSIRSQTPRSSQQLRTSISNASNQNLQHQPSKTTINQEGRQNNGCLPTESPKRLKSPSHGQTFKQTIYNNPSQVPHRVSSPHFCTWVSRAHCPIIINGVQYQNMHHIRPISPSFISRNQTPPLPPKYINNSMPKNNLPSPQIPTRQIQKHFSSQNPSFVEIKSNISQNPNDLNNKSNIKYYSKQTTYQLDEEIAQDLEKFLGLKVN